MSPLRCGCGAEVIPGSLWTPADALAWAREHEGHTAPEAPPRAMLGELPSAEARELRRALAGAYVVGVTTHADGIASVYVKPRRATR